MSWGGLQALIGAFVATVFFTGANAPATHARILNAPPVSYHPHTLTASVAGAVQQRNSAVPGAAATPVFVQVGVPAPAPAPSAPVAPTTVVVQKNDAALSARVDALTSIVGELASLFPNLIAGQQKNQTATINEAVVSDGHPEAVSAGAAINRLSNVTIVNPTITGLSAGAIPDLSGTYLSLNGGALAGNLTTTGSVGVGTTSPGSLLSIGGVANFTSATSTFYATGGINLAGGCFAVSGVCIGGAGGSTANTWTGLQTFSAGASTTRLSVFQNAWFGGAATTTIDSAGNIVGAGTLQLSGLGTLQSGFVSQASSTVVGNLTIGGNGIFSGTTGTTTIAGGQGFAIGGSQFVVQQGSGNVGIGNTAPAAKLTVSRPSLSAFTGTAVGSILVTDTGSTYNNYTTLDFGAAAQNYATARIASLYTTNGTYLTFGTSNNYASGITNQAMTIDPSGDVGIGTVNPQAGLEVNGALRLSGPTQDTFSTPLGTSIVTKINIPLFNPGGFGQIVAMGVPSSALSTSRVLSLFDARTVAHQPTIGTFSPDESSLIGFSWEGINTTAYLKTTSGNLGIRSGTTDLMTLLSGGNVGIGTTSPPFPLSVEAASGVQLRLARSGTNIGDADIGADVNGLHIWGNGYNAATADFNIDGGKVGVGTSPNTSYSLTVNSGLYVAGGTTRVAASNSAGTYYACFGSDLTIYYATSCTASDERLKTNIQALPTSDGLAAITQLQPVTFDWRDEHLNAAEGPQIGFIAQQVQQVLPFFVSTNGTTTITLADGSTSTISNTLAVDYQKLVVPLVEAVQQIATISDEFKQNLIAWFGNAGNGIKDLYATILHANELCLSDQSGTSCYTRSQLDAMLASAGSAVAPVPSSGTSSNTANGATSSPDTPPSIQINGANPAVIQAGSVYNDLGATITGPAADLNLGIHAFVNGTAMDVVKIDTSAAATDTIEYVATDQNGLTATSTRTVIVRAPLVSAAAAASSTPDTASTAAGAATAATTTSATSTTQ